MAAAVVCWDWFAIFQQFPIDFRPFFGWDLASFEIWSILTHRCGPADAFHKLYPPQQEPMECRNYFLNHFKSDLCSISPILTPFYSAFTPCLLHFYSAFTPFYPRLLHFTLLLLHLTRFSFDWCTRVPELPAADVWYSGNSLCLPPVRFDLKIKILQSEIKILQWFFNRKSRFFLLKNDDFRTASRSTSLLRLNVI